MTKTYDSACYNLAAMFLADEPEKNTEENRDKLASHIQREIESEIEFILKPVAPPRAPERILDCIRNQHIDCPGGASVECCLNDEAPPRRRHTP